MACPTEMTRSRRRSQREGWRWKSSLIIICIRNIASARGRVGLIVVYLVCFSDLLFGPCVLHVNITHNVQREARNNHHVSIRDRVLLHGNTVFASHRKYTFVVTSQREGSRWVVVKRTFEWQPVQEVNHSPLANFKTGIQSIATRCGTRLLTLPDEGDDGTGMAKIRFCR